MKSLFLTLALTAVFVTPANAPVVVASEKASSVSVITISGSVGIDL